MKKLWLCGLIMSLYLQGCGQPITPIGVKGRPTNIIGSELRIPYLIPGHVSGKFLAIDPSSGKIVESTPASSGSIPLATAASPGVVRPDESTIHVAVDGTISVISGTGQPLITPGTTGQYYRGDKTFQNLVLAALSNWPSPTGQGGKFLTTDGTNYTWASAAGGSGLSDAYASMTDGTNTATSSGATTFKYRSANNLLSFLIANNDITHGDNLLATINQGNFQLTESQITNLLTDLAAKEPSITAGTNLQVWFGDKVFRTLNTAIVPESGITNLYFNNARVEAYVSTKYQTLTFHDNLDSLNNVNTSGKSIGDHLKWNGSAWVPEAEPAGGSSPTINALNDVTGTYISPNISLTIASGVVINSKLANMANATIKGRITTGTGVPEDINMTQLKGASMLNFGNVDNTSDVTKNAASVTLTNKTISGASNTLSNIPQSAITSLVSALAALAPISGPTFTGTVTLPSTTNATLLTDDAPLLTFGGGSGVTGDTLWVNTGAIYSTVFMGGAYNFVITKMNVILQGSSPNITVDVLYGTTLNSGGTHLVNAGIAVTNTTTGTNITSFNNATIPANNYIWVKTPTVVLGSKPTLMQITLIGHKIRN